VLARKAVNRQLAGAMGIKILGINEPFVGVVDACHVSAQPSPMLIALSPRRSVNRQVGG
jgi:hypothetical protein